VDLARILAPQPSRVHHGAVRTPAFSGAVAAAHQRTEAGGTGQQQQGAGSAWAGLQDVRWPSSEAPVTVA